MCSKQAPSIALGFLDPALVPQFPYIYQNSASKAKKLHYNLPNLEKGYQHQCLRIKSASFFFLSPSYSPFPISFLFLPIRVMLISHFFLLFTLFLKRRETKKSLVQWVHCAKTHDITMIQHYNGYKTCKNKKEEKHNRYEIRKEEKDVKIKCIMKRKIKYMYVYNYSINSLTK